MLRYRLLGSPNFRVQTHKWVTQTCKLPVWTRAWSEQSDMGHVTLTTCRTRRSPSEISLLYNTTMMKLVWKRKISPFYLFTWIFIDFRVSTSEFTWTLWTRKNQLGKFRLLPYVDCACARHSVTSLTYYAVALPVAKIRLCKSGALWNKIFVVFGKYFKSK